MLTHMGQAGKFQTGSRQKSTDALSEAGSLLHVRRAAAWGAIPIQKNNLTSLSRLAVLSVLSQASALLAYFFEWV